MCLHLDYLPPFFMVRGFEDWRASVPILHGRGNDIQHKLKFRSYLPNSCGIKIVIWIGWRFHYCEWICGVLFFWDIDFQLLNSDELSFSPFPLMLLTVELVTRSWIGPILNGPFNCKIRDWLMSLQLVLGHLMMFVTRKPWLHGPLHNQITAALMMFEH